MKSPNFIGKYQFLRIDPLGLKQPTDILVGGHAPPYPPPPWNLRLTEGNIKRLQDKTNDIQIIMNNIIIIIKIITIIIIIRLLINIIKIIIYL